MVKSYPGFGPIFLILFFVITGTWMFINPLLNDNPADYELNYGGLIFTGIGLSLLFTLKIITVHAQGVVVKYIITTKEIIIPRSNISQITIIEEHRNFFEIHITSGRRRGRKTKIEFSNNFAAALTLSPALSSSYNSIVSFLHENYSELINEQELTE
jgi:hypothetical protein